MNNAKNLTLLGTPRLAKLFPLFIFDVASWIFAVVLAYIFRYEFGFNLIDWNDVAIVIAMSLVVFVITSRITHIYQSRFVVGSFEESKFLAITVVTTGVIAWIPTLIPFINIFGVPRSVIPIAIPITLLAIAMTRFMYRMVYEKSFNPSHQASKTLIIGAGFLANNLIASMKVDSNTAYNPVGLIDDDPEKRNAQLHGVKVLGTTDSLIEIIQETQATVIVIAIANADSSFIRKISDAVGGLDVQILVLPSFDEILTGKSSPSDLRSMSIEDLIGRGTVDTDIESIADYLRGKRVLVTGAGGSIGAELSKQISRFNPEELILVDRDETALQMTQISIFKHGLLNTKDTVLLDIRDKQAVFEIFEQRKPHVIFHAAALKHLPLLERFPDEAWKTNVLGTLNVLSAALANDVSTFINISTDKAANPTSVLGHSKRVAEKLTAWAGAASSLKYLSVRFGNVIGSRGSMLPTFQSLIESGGPLTITHPDVTRFFMTIPEACQLVIQAGAIGSSGEVLILDMGEPVKILDIAKRMIALSRKEIEIVYTGLRPGEKLHEELLGHAESDQRPFHPKITHASITPLKPNDLDFEQWLSRCNLGNTES